MASTSIWFLSLYSRTSSGCVNAWFVNTHQQNHSLYLHKLPWTSRFLLLSHLPFCHHYIISSQWPLARQTFHSVCEDAKIFWVLVTMHLIRLIGFFLNNTDWSQDLCMAVSTCPIAHNNNNNNNTFSFLSTLYLWSIKLGRLATCSSSIYIWND